MANVMLLVENPSGEVDCFDGQYLVEYDPTRPGELPDGTPLPFTLVTTPDIRKAKVFDDLKDAFETWRLSNGIRWDGLPNRPLTAFTVTFPEAPGRTEAVDRG